MRRRGALAGCLIVVAILLSIDAAAASRWYQVEVIVFRYTNPTGAEEAVMQGRPPDFSTAISLVSDAPSTANASTEQSGEADAPSPVAFKALPRSELAMAGVYSRLRTLGTYTPVMHVGWRQPGLNNRAPHVFLSDMPRGGASDEVLSPALELESTVIVPKIEGMVRVKTGRTIQVAVDFLSYGAAEPVRIKERRKVVLKELHYFDNPFFGVIMQITPFRVNDPIADDDAVN